MQFPKLTQIFETQTCGRCNGTGHYSYNTKDGTVCYGCRGAKVVWSKRDKRYAEDFLAARRRFVRIPSDALSVGQEVREDSDPTWRVVESIEVIPGTAERNTGCTLVDGKMSAYHPTVIMKLSGLDEYEGHAYLINRRFDLDGVFALCKLPGTVKRIRAAIERFNAQAA